MDSFQHSIELRNRFLEEVANEYGLFHKHREIFLGRFDHQNAESKNTEIAKYLGIEDQVLQDYLGEICELFGFKSQRGRSKKGQSPWEQTFTQLWNQKFNEWLKLQQNPNVQTPILNDDDWLKIFHTKLENQQEQIRKNASEMGFELKFPSVPLGLVERKHQQRRDENVDRRDVYQLEKEVIAKIYEHNDFLEQVINQNSAGKNKHIATVGEPGAGKTTLLTAIASYIKNENKDLPIVISLGSLQGMTLEEYILKKWLPDTMRLVNNTPTSEIEEQLKTRFYKPGVWLLLDGVDEMGESSPTAALNKISQALTDWLGKARVVLTCRLNVWDANPSNNDLSGFDTYKTQEFKPEQIDKFIEEWFKCDDDKIQRGEELKAKLREPGKERIRELVTNPLRLSLLCQIFYQDKHGELPETKAGLFDLYAKYFYYWKSTPETQELRDSPELQKELHQGLGKLALEGIKRDARFRLNKSLVVEVMTERLFKLARDVGWLNLVDRDVYAFFHPNFQEYFAALVIDDWHYFLNHVPTNPVKAKYRVFEPQWREVILLWLGRNDINKNQKDDFMNALIKFDDVSGHFEFYSSQARNLARFGLKEFPESVLNEIVEDGYDDNGNKLYTYRFFKVVTYHLKFPGDLLSHHPITYYKLYQWLGISINLNLDYGSNFLDFLLQMDFRELKNYLIYPKTINSDFDNNDKYHVFDKLKILLSYSKDVDILQAFIQKIGLNYNSDTELLYAIINLIPKNRDHLTSFAARESLKQFLMRSNKHDFFSIIIQNLKPYVNQRELDPYGSCLEIIEYCVENMDYAEFYTAWLLPTSHRDASDNTASPNSHLVNIWELQFTKIISQLQPINTTYPLTLNLKTLQNETDIIEISQEICNQIYFTACPENLEIPQINNAPQLKSKIPQIKKHLKTENLALIINNCEPNQEMIKFCNKLTDVLHIAFITEQPLDAPLKGFPNQSNLFNVIQHWINEIG
ncbi:NACHT domain-containing protein [Dolichospermum flos-aquae]|uniref:NACHT domain-containing protein n=1 Tax=Dolichospermum flos-aquae CCAP 1403/13F TaxID=315271 RepID=A0A6H2C7N5_DOLFA|nr:NACHT domain-containing protein [Dolichospermum flos-aquae]QJB47206.1 NACHT domain-containing protein [Dolichospermum flos-aquae CCAP 1403/13F]